MPFYTLILNDNSKSVVLAESMEELETELANRYSPEFRNEVKEVHWVDKTIHCAMNYRTGEIKRDITTADANPFGYRN